MIIINNQLVMRYILSIKYQHNNHDNYTNYLIVYDTNHKQSNFNEIHSIYQNTTIIILMIIINNQLVMRCVVSINCKDHNHYDNNKQSTCNEIHIIHTIQG